MANTLMGALQAKIRSITGSANDFNGDLHAYADWWGIPMNPISGRLIPIVQKLRSAIGNSTSALNWLLNNSETDIPALGLNFLNSTTLDPRITFSRTSNATQFDSTGTLVYAPHNLVTYSEQMDNAAWTKTRSSITANAIAAPDGTTTADKLIEDTTATSTHQIQLSVSYTAGVTYTRSVYAKAAERSIFRFSFPSGAFTSAISAYFDLSAGTVITVSSPAVATITSVGSGWYRCSMTATATTTVSATEISCGLVVSGTSVTYTGDGTSGLYVWGAQLNVGSLQPYYPTTVKNLLGYTQEFDNAAWTKTRSSIDATKVIAPDGSLTGQKLVEDTTATNTHVIQAGTATVISGTTYSFSIYIKAAERTWALFLTGGTPFGSNGIYVNLATGAAGSTVGSLVSSLITDAGNGWYRVNLIATATAAGSGTLSVRIATGNNVSIYTGDGTSGIYLWGAQLSDSASLDPYVYNPGAAPSAAAYYGPRFDYDPSTLAMRGLLIEEARTNSIRNNTMQGAVAGTPGTLPTNWIQSALGGLTQQVVGTGTENGVTYIDIRYAGTPINTLLTLQLEAATQIAALQNQSWTSSFWVKVVGGDQTNVTSIANRIREIDSVGNALATGTQIITVTSTLTRNLFTRTLTNASTAYVANQIAVAISVGAAIDITLRIGLPQLEQGAFATSVIPTTTAAATRAADSARMLGDNFANWFNATEGSIFSEYSAVVSGTRTVIGINDGTANESIRLRTVSADPFFTVTGGGVDQADIDAGSVISNVVYRFAGAYKQNDFAAVINGGTVGTDTSGTLPTVNQMMLGNSAASNYLNGYLRRVTYFPRRLTNSELQAITT